MRSAAHWLQKFDAPVHHHDLTHLTSNHAVAVCCSAFNCGQRFRTAAAHCNLTGLVEPDISPDPIALDVLHGSVDLRTNQGQRVKVEKVFEHPPTTWPC